MGSPTSPKFEVIVAFVAIHLIAALALLPAFFSWTGVILLFAGYYVFGMLGINLGYHRLLTHRGLSCPLWLTRTLSLLGVCCMQDSPARWVAMHRIHHSHTDDDEDPHSPVKSFIWGHMGWMLVKRPSLRHNELVGRYAKDLLRDPFQAWLDRDRNWGKVALASWAMFFGIGYAAAIVLSNATHAEALQFGASLLVWGAALRTVIFWHLTWAVNSVCHKWGYRNYQTPDASRNNVIVSLLVHGEGWHNNHHADPRSALHGHRRGEFDPTWLLIRSLSRLGLATDIVLPSPAVTRQAMNASAGGPAGDKGPVLEADVIEPSLDAPLRSA